MSNRCEFIAFFAQSYTNCILLYRSVFLLVSFMLGILHLKCIEFLIEGLKQIQFHLKFDIAKTLEEYYIALHFK